MQSKFNATEMGLTETQLTQVKIHEALHYVYHWYKEIGIKEAIKQSIEVMELNNKEIVILFKNINLNSSVLFAKK